MNDGPTPPWCEGLYQAKAGKRSYTVALGLSHAEAEGRGLETFVALLEREEAPAAAEYYCVRRESRAELPAVVLAAGDAREFESRWFRADGGISTQGGRRCGVWQNCRYNVR